MMKREKDHWRERRKTERGSNDKEGKGIMKREKKHREEKEW